MNTLNTPFSKNGKQPTVGALFILLLVGAMIGFQLGRWSNRQEKTIYVTPTLMPSPVSTDAAKDGCARAGCSSELCVESAQSGVMTPCVYKDEYACFSYSRCERQEDGKCGWTQIPEYSQCLNSIGNNP